LKKRISFNAYFLHIVIAFSLAGSSIRVVTDAVDSGKTSLLLDIVRNTHIYDYSFITSSPGIYIVVGALFFISLLIEQITKRKIKAIWIGMTLAMIHGFILFPLLIPQRVLFVLLIVSMALAPFYAARLFLPSPYPLPILAHGLDGAATFIIIDLVSPLTGQNYVEQHVLPNFLSSLAGTFAIFYILKVALSTIISCLIKHELGKEDAYFFISCVVVLGLAPGVRDLLRMWCGV